MPPLTLYWLTWTTSRNLSKRSSMKCALESCQAEFIPGSSPFGQKYCSKLCRSRSAYLKAKKKGNRSPRMHLEKHTYEILKQQASTLVHLKANRYELCPQCLHKIKVLINDA